jgi:uncharacterized membrane protein YedE/YeeE
MIMRMDSRFRRCGLGILLVLTATLSQAYGPRGGHGYRHGGWGYDPWIAPLVFGAAVGTTMYFSRPYPAVPGSTVIITNPPAVIMQNPSGGAGAAPVEAYYCRETAQYFPVVQTCVSPWLVVNPQ